MSSELCDVWAPRQTPVRTLGGAFTCIGVSECNLAVGERSAFVKALVVSGKLWKFDLILGMDAIVALGGVSISSTGVQFTQSTKETCCTALPAVKSEGPGHTARFDKENNIWTCRWKWKGDREPGILKNSLSQYHVPVSALGEFNAEVESWIDYGWLRPYDELELGPPRCLIPLMAVKQANKSKIRPVLDFRALNNYVDAYTGEADVCRERLRNWRRKSENLYVVDLKKAYLQISVDRDLWPFQTIKFRGKLYCLTRLGFGLNAAPSIMQAVVREVMAQDERVKKGSSAYVDDIIIDGDVVDPEMVRAHFKKFGLEGKQVERLADGARVLGLRVSKGVDKRLHWCRDNNIGDIPDVLTRRNVFSVSSKLVSHYPVAGWLRVAASYIKRCAVELTSGWDDQISDDHFKQIFHEMCRRQQSEDPVRGVWKIEGQAASVWVDASSIAVGVQVNVGDDVVEDACWLRRDDQHINLAELDAVLKGVNLAVELGFLEMEVYTDSATVFSWVTDTLSMKERVKTSASSELLIRRRLEILRSVVSEYDLKVVVTQVESERNKADKLTRVPPSWLKRKTQICAVVEPLTIEKIHHDAGHPGVNRTRYFCRRKGVNASKRQIADVVRRCDVCNSVSPAAIKWKKGALSVDEVWTRLAADFTHVNNQLFLSLIDCGPSRFSIWRRLTSRGSQEVAEMFDEIFSERGPPRELLLDNDTTFRGACFVNTMRKWNVAMRYRCVYRAGGNGIVERVHKTVKVIAARKRCSIREAVSLYNISPLDDKEGSRPVDLLYAYAVRMADEVQVQMTAEDENDYHVGDPVWTRRPGERCDSVSKAGTVTAVVSGSVVEVDGLNHHVRDVRPRRHEESAPSEPSGGGAEDIDAQLLVPPVRNSRPEMSFPNSTISDDETGRPRREVRRPARLEDYVVYGDGLDDSSESGGDVSL